MHGSTLIAFWCIVALIVIIVALWIAAAVSEGRDQDRKNHAGWF